MRTEEERAGRLLDAQARAVANPPDRVIDPDDIAFADFGPIFEDFEADLGRTYVLGTDPVKHRLAAACTPGTW
jgi:Xaa-Pro dipeptidase